MSYYMSVSIKCLKPEELFPFLCNLKKKLCTKDVFSTVIKNNACFSPFGNASFSDLERISSRGDFYSSDYFSSCKEWIKDIFTYKIGYHSNLLCAVGLPDEVFSMFDGTYEFQNSTDQDYKLDYWAGVEKFVEIAKKYIAYTDKEIEKKYSEIYEEDFSEHVHAEGQADETKEEYYKRYFNSIEYYRRSFIYKEIYEYISGILYNGSINFACVNSYDDYLKLSDGSFMCFDTVREQLKKELDCINSK